MTSEGWHRRLLSYKSNYVLMAFYFLCRSFFVWKGDSMAFIFYNPNPANKKVGDCVIRAISKITGKEWDEVYIDVCMEGYRLHDMPTANHVWGSYLAKEGFHRNIIPDTCPECYTVEQFCNDHPFGSFILATGTHVVAVVNGNYYDSWDSGEEVPVYYWKEGE
jgi:hypothetical protein